MVIEREVPPFFEWIGGASITWAAAVGILALGGLLLAWLVMALRFGPQVASETAGRTILEAISDLSRFSIRRTMAMAWLAVKESVRRLIFLVFAVFLLVLSFAAWYLDFSFVAAVDANPVRQYLEFAIFWPNLFILLMMLLLCTQSLPTDIAQRTLHSIVTKPVRPSEIILGRILGFGGVGLILVALIAVTNYVFVVRGFRHEHEVVLADLKVESQKGSGPDQADEIVWKGVTNTVKGHRHDIEIDASGVARLSVAQGHWHSLTVDKADLPKPAATAGTAAPQRPVRTGLAEGQLVARVPVYGQLRFLDRAGMPANKGICVGDEWTYRSYIDGGSLSAAIWRFDNLRESDFPKGLPLEMTMGIFRTHKGEVGKGVPGSLTLVNPQTGLKADVKLFRAKEFVIDSFFIPRKIRMPDGSERDLFRDFVSDGSVEVWLRCLQHMQCFGVARPDLYLRASDARFGWNYAKGYLGVSLQMMMVLAVGITFSTFLGGPVSLFATLSSFLVGYFFDFFVEVASGKNWGGGPLESGLRLLRQDNVVTPLEPGLRTTMIHSLDWVFQKVLTLLSYILPDFSQFSFQDYVLEGFNVPWNVVAVQTVTVLGFIIPAIVAAYFLFKSREVAQ